MFRFLIQILARGAASSTLAWVLVLGLALALPAVAQQSDSHDKKLDDKKLDIRTSAGDLHLGTDADARKIGLPPYPGARLRHDSDKDRNSVNLGILTEAFGMKLLVANYDSDDPPEKITDYYRDKLKKYGKVLECHTREHGGNIDADVKHDENQQSKELKCEGDNSGPVTELKVGTEDDQHMVAVEPHDKGPGSNFALVYLHLRGKRGEI
jgi:hypothetical protein